MLFWAPLPYCFIKGLIKILYLAMKALFKQFIISKIFKN